MKNLISTASWPVLCLSLIGLLGAVVLDSEGNTPSHSMAVTETKRNDRFVTLYKQESPDTTVIVFQDSETGKKYLYFMYYQSGGLTEMR